MYIRRSEHIATEEERERWQQLDNNYMTDESSVIILPGDLVVGLEQIDTAGVIIVHKHNFYHYISVVVFQS